MQDSLVNLVEEVPQVSLVIKGTLETVVRLDHVETQVVLELLEPMDFQDSKVHRVQLDQRDREDNQVLLGIRVTRDLKDSQDLEEMPVAPEHLGRKVLQDNQVTPDSPDPRDHRALQGSLELKDREDRAASKEPLDRLGLLDLQA